MRADTVTGDEWVLGQLMHHHSFQFAAPFAGADHPLLEPIIAEAMKGFEFAAPRERRMDKRRPFILHDLNSRRLQPANKPLSLNLCLAISLLNSRRILIGD